MSNNIQTPDYKHEQKLIDLDGFRMIAGIDEAGRGPGAGPVVASAVYIPPTMIKKLYGRLNDSKKLSETKRNKLYVIIKTTCTYGTGVSDNNEIDQVNILEATKLAMQRAYLSLNEKLNQRIDYLLIDGNMRFNQFDIPYESIVKGDSKSLSIAAGSIIAKVTRDRYMKKIHEEFPIYGWESNKGYLSKKHIDAIRKHGTTHYHRLSFNKVGRDE